MRNSDVNKGFEKKFRTLAMVCSASWLVYVTAVWAVASDVTRIFSFAEKSRYVSLTLGVQSAVRGGGGDSDFTEWVPFIQVDSCRKYISFTHM